MKGISIYAIIMAMLSITPVVAQDITITKSAEKFKTHFQPPDDITFLMTKEGKHYYYLHQYGAGKEKILIFDDALNYIDEIAINETYSTHEKLLGVEALGETLYLFTHEIIEREQNTSVRIYPINKDGSLGNPKTIATFTLQESKRYDGDVAIAVSEDNKNLLVYLTEYTQLSKKEDGPTLLHAISFDAVTLQKKWDDKIPMKKHGKAQKRIEREKNGFIDFEQHLDNEGNFSVIIGSSFFSWGHTGELLIQQEDITPYFKGATNVKYSRVGLSVYHTQKKILFGSTQLEETPEGWLIFYTYVFYEKNTGKPIKKGHALLNDLLLESGRELKQNGAFLGPQFVVEGEQVYAIIEEFTGSATWLTDNVFLDLLVMKHDTAGKLYNVFYIPKGQYINNTSKKYYNGSFAAIAANGQLYIYYTHIGSLAFKSKSEYNVPDDNEKGMVYQVKIDENDKVTKTPFYDAYKDLDPMRTGTLHKTGPDEYLIILESSPLAKLAKLKVN